MEKIKSIFNLSIKFANKYFKEYCSLIKKPILIFFIGFIPMLFLTVHPFFCILALFITLPAIFYSFWQFYMIIFSINGAAFHFIKKQPNVSIFQQLIYTKANAKDLAKWMSFVALISLTAYIPAIYDVIKNVSLISISANYVEPKIGLAQTSLTFIINLLFIPFINYSMQAFYFKKTDESYIDLFLNCYRKLDKTGIAIALIMVLISAFIIYTGPLGMLLGLFYPLIMNSANTFYYMTRINNNLQNC